MNIIKSNKIFCVIAICCIVSLLSLLFSFQTREVMTANAETENFIQLSVIDKNNGVWEIGVTNKQSHKIKVEYNEYMCFGSDAKEWDLSNDVRYIGNFQSNMSCSVKISENYFAGYIAFSYQYGGKRYITYANKLNNDKKTLSISNTVI